MLKAAKEMKAPEIQIDDREVRKEKVKITKMFRKDRKTIQMAVMKEERMEGVKKDGKAVCLGSRAPRRCAGWSSARRSLPKGCVRV